MSDDEERIDVESEDVHDRSNAQLSSHLVSGYHYSLHSLGATER